jgi:hypothetical protein
MVCTTVILLVVLCFICLLVFLRTTEKRKKTQKKEGFTEDTCDTELTCSPGQLKHTVNSGTPSPKSGCCDSNLKGMGYYFDGLDGCKVCPTESSANKARLQDYEPIAINSSNVITDESSTIGACYAVCKNQSAAPYEGSYGQTGGAYYNTDECSKLTYYSNVKSNLYLKTTSQEIAVDQTCSNITASNAHNSNAYCCSNDTWLRYNSNYNPDKLQCCPSNKYLNSNGGCDPCPNNQWIDTSNADRSGITACYINNCKFGPSNAHYSDLTESGYNCKSNYYHYYKDPSLTPSQEGVVKVISEGSNDISYNGSNYFYPHDSLVLSNDTIGSNDFDTSSSNWYYDNGANSNDNTIYSSNLKTTSYTQQLTYSNYYECSNNTYLRCETTAATSDTPATPGTRSCICCASDQYNSNAVGKCENINTNTQVIANSNLKPGNKEACDPGWGKPPPSGGDICIPCEDYEYSAGGSNTCQKCPHGQYPNSNDRSNCIYADGSLTEVKYRIKKDTPVAEYLHYADSNVFERVASNYLKYGDSDSNMYVWEDESTPMQYYLQVEDGKFLVNTTPTSSALSAGQEKAGSLTFNLIPYCPAGKYADGDSCSNCPAGTWSQTPGLEASDGCSPCQPGTWSGDTGRTSNCTLCEVGYECTGGVQSPCSATNQYQDEQGQSNCKPVTEGYYKIDNSNIKLCELGHKCTSGEMSMCLAGTYSASNGSSNCSNCSAGTYSASNGSSNCSDCAPGTYSTSNGSSNCYQLGNFNNPFDNHWGKQVNSSNTGLEDRITGTNKNHWEACYENTHCLTGAKCTRLDYDNSPGRCLPDGYPMVWCMDRNAVAHNEKTLDYPDTEFKKNLFKCKYTDIFVNGTNDGGHFTLNLNPTGKTGLGSYGNRLAMTTCAYKWQTDSCNTTTKSCSIKHAGSTNSDCWEFKNGNWDDMVKNQEDCTLNRNEKSFMIKPVPGSPLNNPKVTVHGAHEFANRCLKYASGTDARMKMTTGDNCQQFYLRNEGGDCSSSSSPPALAFPEGGSGR